MFLVHHPLDMVVLPSMRSRPPHVPSSAWNPWLDLRQRDDVHALNISFPWGQMPGNEGYMTSVIVTNYNLIQRQSCFSVV